MFGLVPSSLRSFLGSCRDGLEDSQSKEGTGIRVLADAMGRGVARRPAND